MIEEGEATLIHQLDNVAADVFGDGIVGDVIAALR